jgi:hypothetical protein
MRTRTVPAEVAAAGCGVAVYSIVYAGLISLASAVWAVPDIYMWTWWSAVALIPASIALMLNYWWAYILVAVLLLPGLAGTAWFFTRLSSAGDVVLAVFLLAVPAVALAVIIRGLAARVRQRRDDAT